MGTTILKLFFVLLVLQKRYCSLAESDDRDALLALKAGFKNSFLDANWTGPLCRLKNTASWYGIKCSNGRVTGISLKNLGLTGGIRPDSLANLTELQTLSFKNNHLSGKLMDFSNNKKLRRVDLSGNRFEGNIPPSLLKLPLLESLQLQSNNLIGQIPEPNHSILKKFTISRDDHPVEIPIFKSSVKRLETFSHVANDTTSQPKDNDCNKSGKSGALPFLIVTIVLAIVVLLFLSIYYYKKSKRLEVELMMIKKNNSPMQGGVKDNNHHHHKNQNQNQNQNRNHIHNEMDQSVEMKSATRENSTNSTQILSIESTERSSNNLGGGGDAAERGKLTFLDSDLRIELDDLLKASAEGLGKGNFGNCYKAMLEQGPTVVVKRLRDLKPLGREEFVAHVKSISNKKHPNLLPLLGYYYAKDEKLLLYKFAPNGNLYTRIQRGKGTRERIPFRWNARLSVARAVARAVEYLHLHSTAPQGATGGGGNHNPPHGNLKSTNVLLDESDVVLLTDYGLASIIAQPIATHRMVSYRSPEFQAYKKVCAKSDVWSYGCLLLELLTGRVSSHSAPPGVNGADLCSWVHRAVREEWTAEIFDAEISAQRSASQGMLRLLQIAIRCCEKSPEKRPEMSEVVREVEKIKSSGDSDQEDDDLSLTDNSASQTPSH